MLEQIQRRATKMIRAALLQGQTERARIVQPGKEKSLVTPYNTFQCLGGSLQDCWEGLFTRALVTGQWVMALN